MWHQTHLIMLTMWSLDVMSLSTTTKGSCYYERFSAFDALLVALRHPYPASINDGYACNDLADPEPLPRSRYARSADNS
jgi:hypothetical protein